MPLFTIHEHHARHLHYDFRLEMDGVLKSWAVPKGPSMSPKDKRLAIMVEDHALEYGKYEGIIPEGSYGAGPVLIWDTGEYEHLGGTIDEGKVDFYLCGRKLKGRFVLTRFKGKDKEWLLIKKNDEYSLKTFTISPELSKERLAKLKGKTSSCDAR